MIYKTKSLLLIVFMTLITATGLFFFKKSAEALAFTFEGMIINYNLWLGFIFYAAGMLIFIYALKKNDMSTVVPFLSLTYVWVFIMSLFFLREVATPEIIGGNILIIAGAVFLSLGERRKKK